MDHQNALGRGQASAYTDIPHLGVSVQLCACPDALHPATPLGSCATPPRMLRK